MGIEEREPFALWQKDGKVSLIAADGTMLAPLDDPQYAALPLVVGVTLAQDNTPIAPALAGQLRQFGTNLDVIAPASFFSAVIPLTIFVLFQRYFVQGLLAGSVK